MISPWTIGLSCVAGMELWEAFVARRGARRTAFRRAVELATATRTPLMVVGDPDSGFVTKFFGRDYGCGDLCTDLTGCPSCPVGPARTAGDGPVTRRVTTLRGRLEDVLPRVTSRSHVIFESLTLEYVDDLPRVVQELERVAITTPRRDALSGIAPVPGQPALFTAGRIDTTSSTHWLHTPASNWVIYSERPWKWRRR